MEPSPLLGCRVFRAVPEQVGEVRRWLRAVAGRDCPDAQECLSEIFTNTIRHSRSGAARGLVTVLALDIPPALRVEVTDAGGRTVPRLLPLDTDAAGGRGLHLVSAFTGGRWGWHGSRAHRTVWFECIS